MDPCGWMVNAWPITCEYKKGGHLNPPSAMNLISIAFLYANKHFTIL